MSRVTPFVRTALIDGIVKLYQRCSISKNPLTGKHKNVVSKKKNLQKLIFLSNTIYV